MVCTQYNDYLRDILSPVDFFVVVLVNTLYDSTHPAAIEILELPPIVLNNYSARSTVPLLNCFVFLSDFADK